MTPFLAELIGTFLLILLGNGVNANLFLNDTKAEQSKTDWLFISIGWAFAVYVGVLVAAPFSGAHLNPAVSIGLAVAGKLEWSLLPTYVLAQIIGAVLGSLFVYLFYYQQYQRTEDEALKLATFSTAPAIRNYFSNLFSECMGAFVLIFVILYISRPELKLISLEQGLFGLGSIGALPVALLVLVIGMALGGTTGYAINPARDLGPRIVHQLLPIKGTSDWSYAWVPVVGPILGGVIAASIYLLL